MGAREELVNPWPAPGTIATSVGQTSGDVGADAGVGLRNASEFGFVVLSELDDFDTGYPAQGSAQAIDKGCADVFLYLARSHRDLDRDAGNRHIFNFMAAWLQGKLGIPVYVIDIAWSSPGCVSACPTALSTPIMRIAGNAPAVPSAGSHVRPSPSLFPPERVPKTLSAQRRSSHARQLLVGWSGWRPGRR